jgi:hypothetical protein
MDFTLPVNKYIQRFFAGTVLPVVMMLSFFSCTQNHNNRKIARCFYYWKSVFNITPAEQQQLNALDVKTLYIKCFDVDWDEAARSPRPVAKLQQGNTQKKDSFKIIPTIFITNECIQKIDSVQAQQLAIQVYQLLTDIITANSFIAEELQIDCDWTATSSNNYFLFLKKFKQLTTLPISATIRLHQVKFFSKTGIPPVDRGLLMCYNMGNLKDPATANSIIDAAEVKKYIGNLAVYPLPLDVALPLFEWKVLFRNNIYNGLVEDLPDSVFSSSFTTIKENRYELLKDTLLLGYALKKGDVIRNEKSNYDAVLDAAAVINKQLKNTTLRVSLFHLDTVLLNKYSHNELEAIYNSLR